MMSCRFPSEFHQLDEKKAHPNTRATALINNSNRRSKRCRIKYYFLFFDHLPEVRKKCLSCPAIACSGTCRLDLGDPGPLLHFRRCSDPPAYPTETCRTNSTLKRKTVGSHSVSHQLVPLPNQWFTSARQLISISSLSSIERVQEEPAFLVVHLLVINWIRYCEQAIPKAPLQYGLRWKNL